MGSVPGTISCPVADVVTIVPSQAAFCNFITIENLCLRLQSELPTKQQVTDRTRANHLHDMVCTGWVCEYSRATSSWLYFPAIQVWPNAWEYHSGADNNCQQWYNFTMTHIANCLEREYWHIQNINLPSIIRFVEIEFLLLKSNYHFGLSELIFLLCWNWISNMDCTCWNWFLKVAMLKLIDLIV